MLQLPKGTPKLVIECIFLKMMNGFEEPVKMDVLNAKVVNKALVKLFPPKLEGKYFVSYLGLDDEMQQKVYNHQSWYKKMVEVVPVSGFNNIN